MYRNSTTLNKGSSEEPGNSYLLLNRILGNFSNNSANHASKSNFSNTNLNNSNNNNLKNNNSSSNIGASNNSNMHDSNQGIIYPPPSNNSYNNISSKQI